LQIKTADVSFDAAGNARIKIEGSVTVFQAFSVFNQPVTFQMLGRTISFKPDPRGQARTAGGEFQIKNASRYGVIYGGLMEFELTLQGEEWRAALEKLELTKAGARRVNIQISVQVGTASHLGTTEVQRVAP